MVEPAGTTISTREDCASDSNFEEDNDMKQEDQEVQVQVDGQSHDRDTAKRMSESIPGQPNDSGKYNRNSNDDDANDDDEVQQGEVGAGGEAGKQGEVADKGSSIIGESTAQEGEPVAMAGASTRAGTSQKISINSKNTSNINSNSKSNINSSSNRYSNTNSSGESTAWNPANAKVFDVYMDNGSSQTSQLLDIFACENNHKELSESNINSKRKHGEEGLELYNSGTGERSHGFLDKMNEKKIKLDSTIVSEKKQPSSLSLPMVKLEPHQQLPQQM